MFARKKRPYHENAVSGATGRQRSVLLQQPVQHQAVKKVAPAGIAPAHMRCTAAAQHNLPAVALKPAPFFVGRTCHYAALRAPEAADLKQQACGIRECMPVRALNLNALSRCCNKLQALPAEYLIAA
jgi:hypothetical protein